MVNQESSNGNGDGSSNGQNGAATASSIRQPLLPQSSLRSSSSTPANWSDITIYKGAKLAPAAAAIAAGLAIRYAVPVPEGLTDQAWSLLALFVTMVSGLVLAPLPTGAWAFLGATAGLLTHTLTFEQMFAAANNTVMWLVVVSFFLARGFEKTGLGERIANNLLTVCGSSSLQLALGLAAAEVLITPAMPSTTARAAGIFMPVIKSVSQAVGSMPGDESRKQLGAFLMQAQFQSSVHSSNFVMTAAAQNLLCLQMAASVGVSLGDPFMTWLAGSSVPVLLGVVLTPCVLYWLWPPAITSTPHAPAAARARLQEMGPLSADEGVMIGAVTLAVGLWVFGGQLGVAPVTAAMCALGVLLASGVLSWQDCLQYTPAWDTLIWFTVLVSMAGGLQSLGVIDLFSGWAGGQLSGLDLPWPALFAGLHLLFFGMHYLFASQTAHVGALFAAFCSLMISAGVPPQLAAMSLAYNVNLFGSLTHYASGQAAVYFGAGYLKTEDVFLQGAACAAANLLLWGSVGMLWWKVLGWY
ncbi:hypothetical protein OEZ86_002013 [Tetradesmus obliquus]|nr:hypothetical protein OEZ86_002013 [Tetradesmus obliquus]